MGPYVTSVTDTGAEVRFELAASAPARLEIRGGADGGKAAVFADAAPATFHRFVATGLAPATAYAYVVRAGAGGEVAGEGRFATAPRPTSHAPVRFIAYGDDRSDPTAHARVVDAMRQVPSDFLVNTGDMVADGADLSDWQSFFSVEAPLLRERPLLVAIGNHELRTDQAGTNFARYFGFVDGAGAQHLYGTTRYGSVRLFFLNAWHDWRSGEERDWLARALADSDAEPDLVWRVAVVHQAPWSVGPHGPNRALVEGGVPQLLAEHHVDLLFGGHDHIYDRGDAGVVKYVVTGGGGAPLYPIDPDRERADRTKRRAEAAYHFVEVTASDDALRIVARRADGSILERCGFAKDKPWDCDPPPPPPAPSTAESPAAAPSAPSSPRCACSSVGASPAPPPLGAFGLAATALAAFGARRSARRRG